MQEKYIAEYWLSNSEAVHLSANNKYQVQQHRGGQ